MSPQILKNLKKALNDQRNILSNPLFDILPTVLEQAPPDVKVQLVLIGSPDEMRQDGRTMKILSRVTEIMERKNAPTIKAFPTEEMGEAEIEATQLVQKGRS